MLAKHQLSPRSICDVGCGTAGVLACLSHSLSAATRLVGYEPSSQAIKLAGERTSRIDIRAADATTCHETFEVMLLLDVVEHIPDYLGFLRSLADRAERYIFHIPLDMSVQAVLRMKPLLRARAKSGHLHYFSRETALASLAECGYEVMDEVFTRGGLELTSVSRAARAVAMPRRAAYALHPPFAARVLGGFSLMVLARPS
jgi:trans-aconitate methyltransferase